MENAMGKKRKLRSLSHTQVLALIREGIGTFHNGGQTRRYVVGMGVPYIYCKRSLHSRTTTGIWMDDFAKWCKGYIDDKDGKSYVLNENGDWMEFKNKEEIK